MHKYVYNKQFSVDSMVCDSGWGNKQPDGVLSDFNVKYIHPDLVLTDNGAYDLEKQGLKGHYVWVGYLHSITGKPNHRMDKYVEEAAYKIADLYRKAYGKEATVEDKMNTTDMFRIWIAE